MAPWSTLPAIQTDDRRPTRAAVDSVVQIRVFVVVAGVWRVPVPIVHVVEVVVMWNGAVTASVAVNVVVLGGVVGPMGRTVRHGQPILLARGNRPGMLTGLDSGSDGDHPLY